MMIDFDCYDSCIYEQQKIENYGLYNLMRFDQLSRYRNNFSFGH